MIDLRIATYTCDDPWIPEKFRALAHLITPAGEMAPIRFNAENSSVARFKAEQWIIEQEKLAKDKQPPEPKAKEGEPLRVYPNLEKARAVAAAKKGKPDDGKTSSA